MTERLYVLRAGEPYRGHVQSIIDKNGKVAWSGGLSPEEYAREHGFEIRIIGEAELRALDDAHVASLVTAPYEETEDQWEYALNVLPPSRWTDYRGVNMFHICERVTHDLVAWHCRFSGKFYTFNDRADAPKEAIAAKVVTALEADLKPMLCESASFVLYAQTGNAAFGDSRAEKAEAVASLLRKVAARLEADPNYSLFKSILDENGNACGAFRLSRDA